MIAPLPSDDIRFPSLASLRVAHADLLRRSRESSGSPDFQTDIQSFIRRGQATGALLDESEDRWEAQSILDYWATHLFRMDRTTVDATLDELDLALAPELDDAACPYVGLDAFGESKFEVFFGRQRLVQAMLEHLATERFLAIVGSSGSGKSSVALAGLVAALRTGGLPGSVTWHYPPSLVPGSEPLVNLIRGLSPPGTGAAEIASRVARLREDPRYLLELVEPEAGRPCVLVIDQLEEIFTLCDEEPVRQAFADALGLLAQAPGVRHTLLVTLRSDYESRVAQLGSFQALFERAQVRVTPMSAPDLREAIVRPAELVGLKFEEGVVDALLRDILGEPAGLPLLQFTLLKLWENRERNRVTWEAYRRLGGGRLALARSADQLYASLIPEEQVTARRLLLRMVRPSEGLEVMSSRIRRAHLYRGGEDPGRVDRVLEKLIGARLVRLTRGETPEDDQVEVAHEALVRNWPKLVEWLEEERSEIATRRRLESRVKEWIDLDGRGGLLDEVQLQEAERWLGSPSASLLGFHEELPALVQASRMAIDERRRRLEEARQRELDLKTRSSRIFRTLACIFGALLVLVLWISTRALDAQRSANEAEREAHAFQIKANESERELQRVRLTQQEAARRLAEKSNWEMRRALSEIQKQKERAELALEELRKQKKLTEDALEEANRQTQLTKAALEEVEEQKQLLEDALEQESTQRDLAQAALAEAKEEREKAQKEREEADAQRLRAEEALAKYEQAREQVAETRSQNVRLSSTPARPSSRVLASPKEMKLDQRTRPLRLGASISSLEGGTGSLCCVVRDEAGLRYLLSLASIFDGEPGAPVLQPGRLDGGLPQEDRVAVLAWVGRDRNKSGALARLDPGVKVDFKISEIGRIKGIETTVHPGDTVRLVGRSSGIVEGKVIQANDREVVTTIIPSGGDAGGPVLSDDGDLVGLLYGSDKLQSFVVRIEPILRELNVRLVED